MRTQKELSQRWRDLQTTDKPRGAEDRGRATAVFIDEVLAHPFAEWAVARDAEFEISIADQEYAAGEVALFLRQAADILHQEPAKLRHQFARLVGDAVEQFVGIEMHSARRHKLFEAIVEERTE